MKVSILSFLGIYFQKIASPKFLEQIWRVIILAPFELILLEYIGLKKSNG